MAQSLLPFVLFALVACISPGPTNLLILAHGAQRGLRASVAPILSGCLAAAGMVWVVGLGLAEVLLQHPVAQQLMSWLGVLWLSWLGWQLLRSAAAPLHGTQRARFGAVSAATLQLINPKVWMMAIAIIGVFAAPGQPVWQLALIFLIIALPCMAAWALLGVGSARWLQSPQRVRRFNQLLAWLLIVSAWSALLA